MTDAPAPTPTTTAAMESGVKEDDVKVVASTPLPTNAKLAHVLAALIAGVIAMAVAVVLADGESVIVLKEVRDLPIITNPTYKNLGLHHRADELLGPTYGIGLHHDQSGMTWTQIRAESTLSHLIEQLGVPVVIAALPHVTHEDSIKHPVPFLECDDLQMAGLAALWLGGIAEATAVLMILFHCLVLAGLLPSKYAKPLGAFVWLILTSGFLIVILLAIGVYTAEWTCKNDFIPKIVLSEHFEYAYGFVFAIVGFISSLLILCVVLCFTSMSDGTAGAPPAKLGRGAIGALLGIVIGVVAAAALGLIVAGANDGFTPPVVDPDVNPCHKQKPYSAGPSISGKYAPGDSYFKNTACMVDGVTQTLEQAGANVTRGYKGLMDAGERVPITAHYKDTALCAVNVHWHLGAEHLSVGEFDELGKGPPGPPPLPYYIGGGGVNAPSPPPPYKEPRRGFRCRHYDATDPKFTTEYNWQHCDKTMKVGETYEVHWPHSAAGACGTDWQFQSPFYDGVFCNDGVISIAPLNTYENIGVQGQVFTIVNSDDPQYYHDNLMYEALTGGEYWQDVAMYTGSTTGGSRNNEVCSRYTPITWQVDRKCHLISASSFDKMCADMMAQRDDMHMDLHAHAAREVSADHLVANNQQSRK